jgi:hypothetical protein
MVAALFPAPARRAPKYVLPTRLGKVCGPRGYQWFLLLKFGVVVLGVVSHRTALGLSEKASSIILSYSDNDFV